MANKPLDSSDSSGKMLKASAKAVRGQQEKVCPACHVGNCYGHVHEFLGQDNLVYICRCADPDQHHGKLKPQSVIITPDPPDRCIWCSSQPVSPEHDPYCSPECAVLAQADDWRDA